MSYFAVTVEHGPNWDSSRSMLAVQAEDEREIDARLAGDPWRQMELLRTATIEPWEILLRSWTP